MPLDPSIVEYLKKKGLLPAGVTSTAQTAGVEGTLSATKTPPATPIPQNGQFGFPDALAVSLSGLGDAFKTAGGYQGSGSAAATLDALQKAPAAATARIKSARELGELTEDDDPASETSKQYQSLAAKYTGKPLDSFAGASATKIKAVLPIIEKAYQADEANKTRKDIAEENRLSREAMLKLAESNKQAKGTVAQQAVDKKFGTEYADYVAGGGFGDTMTQLSTLQGVLDQLKAGKSNLTGPGIGALPDFARKRTYKESWAAQQAVEQSVQRTLKKTLGGQFTEREGLLFMQRGYDPSLPEKENAEKLERSVGQLKIMAKAKQEAVDYYEKNGTLNGYKGRFYTLRDGQVVEATQQDFNEMINGSITGRDQSKTIDDKGYEVGKRYKMKDGVMATYKGGGVFE